MRNEMAHLSDWTLEQLAEGLLPADELSEASAHLEHCDRCAAELEGARSLLEALSNLPRFEPAAGFSEAVMARVRVAPQTAAAWSWMQSRLPSTRRGWMLLAALSAVPALGMFGVVAWVLSQSALTPAGIGGWATTGLSTAAHAAWATLIGWGIETGTFGAIRSVYRASASVPLGLLAGSLAVLAIAIPLSAWSLVRLVRTPMRKLTYAD